MACVRTRTMGAPLSFCLRVWKRPGRVARFVPLRRRFVPMAASRSLQSVVARGGLGPERLRALRLRQRPRRPGLVASPTACSEADYSAGRAWNRLPAREFDTCQGPPRSEEHTSELQSLMRISYAVFC